MTGLSRGVFRKSVVVASCLLIALLAVTAGVSAWQQESGSTGSRPGIRLLEQFRQLDADRDEQLTESELGARLFGYLNQNDDEIVTLEEARSVFQRDGAAAVQAELTKAKSGSAETSAAEELKPVPEPIRQGPQRLVPGDAGVGRMLPDLEVTDLDGQTARLQSLMSDRVTVLAFTNTTCPLCLKYAPTLAAMEDRFRGHQVRFLYVNPTTGESPDRLKAFIQQHGFDGRYLLDPDGQLAQAAGATHTTVAVVLDARRTVLYRGAVDDQYGFGYAIETPRINYLADAITATLNDHRPAVEATTAPGCPLEFDEVQTDSRSVTWHNRISRIVQNHCENCHRDGGVAPFALTTFQEVSGQTGAIRRVLNENLMPPWFAAPPQDGGPSPFANDCSLASQDKAAFLQWLDSGRPEGDPADAPLPRTYHGGWHIGQPDHIVQIPTPIAVKATGTMRYQNVVVETGLSETRYLKAVEILPTARQVVHHVLVFVVPPEAPRTGQEGIVTDEEGEGEGADGFFAAYAPGYDAQPFHSGYGKVLPAGARLRFQIHYTPNGTATEDQSMLGMVFLDEKPEHLVEVKGVAQPRLAIPPRTDNHEVTAEQPIPADVTLLAFFPHMHLRGKAFRYEVRTPDGQVETLLDVPRYDFNWQLSYRLAEPITLPAGSTLRAIAWYDNSENNPANPDPSRTVRWGPQTDEEMMIGYVEYHMAGGSLGRSFRNRLQPGAGLQLVFNRLDANRDGYLSEDELPEDQRDRLLRLDADNDGLITLDEARTLLRRRNQ